MAAWWVALLAGVQLVACQPTSDTKGRLLVASVVVRHGDRTPMEPCPSDPLRTYKKQRFGGWTKLTLVGEEQHRELGEWLRARYGAVTTPDEVQVTSSDTDRTIRSARSLLGGLAPHGPRIPVNVIPWHLDKVVSSKRQCGAYRQQLEALERSAFMHCMISLNAGVFEKLSQHCGAPVQKLSGISYLYNVFHVEDQHNMPLPDWSRLVYPDALRDQAIYSLFTLPVLTRKMLKIKSGVLMAELVNHMRAAATKKLQPARRKLFMYSGHDTTIAFLQQALGVYRPHWVPFASAMMIELRRHAPGDHRVTVWYRNSTDHAPYLLQIPGCTKACPLELFTCLIMDVTLHDWNNECSRETADTDIELDFSDRGLPEEWKVCLHDKKYSNSISHQVKKDILTTCS